MFHHHLRITLRTLRKNKILSFINVVSLAIGLAVSFLIFVYVKFESGYDTFHTKSDRIYRVESQFYEGEELTDDWATSSFGYGSAMKDNLTGIEGMSRLALHLPEQIVSYEGEHVRENGITFADSSFLHIFDFELIEGSKYQALSHTNTVVITKSIADKFFKGQSALGKTLIFGTSDQRMKCEVSGVLEDIPDNSHIKFDYFISYRSLPQWQKEFWYMHEAYTYVLLDENADPKRIEEAFPAMAEKYKTRDALKAKTWAISLVPLKDIHLSAWKQYEKRGEGGQKGPCRIGDYCHHYFGHCLE